MTGDWQVDQKPQVLPEHPLRVQRAMTTGLQRELSDLHLILVPPFPAPLEWYSAASSVSLGLSLRSLRWVSVLRQNCLSTLGMHLHTPWIHMQVWEGSGRRHRDASEDKVEEEVLHWATSHQSLRAEGHIDVEQLLPDRSSFSLGPPGSMHNVHVSVTW